eukprot:comp8026_c0_seq1/m.3531 comp8026_c0_seq1/g.3531  ORF comp8026_c0_seq1/g.3531 comp8026_c0_seq1/m.3531 type:complete len:161 (-) comp8026_c0_seq1:429-911(-)
MFALRQTAGVVGAWRTGCRAVSARCLATAAKQEDVLSATNKDIARTSSKDLFAVVHIAGKQHKVGFNDTIVVNKMPIELGSEITFNKVLLAGSKNFSLVGTPLLDPSLVTVKARVVEHTETKPTIVYKKKRRKGYERWREIPQPITVLRVTSLNASPNLQ